MTSRQFEGAESISRRLSALVDLLKTRQSALSMKSVAAQAIKKDLVALGAKNGSFKLGNQNLAGKHLPLTALPDDLAQALRGKV